MRDRYKVLLIEDSAADRRLISESLKSPSAGAFELSTAETLAAGMEMLRDEAFDILLLDLHLPDSGGLDTFARVAMDFPDLPTVVLTGLKDESAADRAISMGAQDYLPKGEISDSLLSRSIRYAMERKRAEMALVGANRELERYGHMVSHDLRSPLGAISLACEMLSDVREMDAAEVREEVTEAVGSIRRSLTKCNNLIDDLLALARTGSVESSVVDVRSVVDGILEERAAEISRNGATVEVDEDLGEVRASEVHVYQLFSNLISNALGHNRVPEPLVEVRSLPARGDHERRFLVRDNGRGFPLEMLDESTRPPAKGKEGGTGLGLSIITRVIERYDGEFEVYNDRGACFEFTLAHVD